MFFSQLEAPVDLLELLDLLKCEVKVGNLHIGGGLAIQVLVLNYFQLLISRRLNI